jgi:HTH-type transcriptional regulator, glycine betaine synthesis regulator
VSPLTPDPTPQTTQAQERFVMEWGRMSSSWGINRTMAQLHALLLITGQSLTMDEMIERLHISRGNASMNLRDLHEWGVISRYRHPGDRKDVYHAPDDIVQMFAHVVRERKRREIDPTVSAIRDCMAMVPESDHSHEAEVLRNRLAVLLELFEIFDEIFKQIFASNESVKTMFESFSHPKSKTPEDSPG